MPHIIETTVYKFDELDDSAKEKARQWYREGALEFDWWDSVYEDAAECGAILGIDLRQRVAKLMGGGTRLDPAIYFSGFSSQGDGACFEGSYCYAKGAPKKIREHAPQDSQLHRIADALQELQRRNFYRLTASMTHRGHYSHSGCMSVDVEGNESRTKDWAHVESELTDLMRAFADWIYGQLEKEYEYQMADEQVDDAIRANEYDFEEDGRRA